MSANKPPAAKGAEPNKKSGGGFWNKVGKALNNISFEVNVGPPASGRRGPAGDPTDPAARMEPVRQDRKETYDEMVYRTTDGTAGQAPAVRVDRERQHVARSLEARGASPQGGAPIPKGGGEPLSKDVRARMEPKLGADLSNVTVHRSGESAAAAQGMNAKAFAVGQDVHFGSGQYQPGSKEGDRLLAHELAHTVQAQRSGVQRKADDGEAHAEGHEGGGVSHPEEPAEKEADHVADHVTDQLHDGAGKGGASAGAAEHKAPAAAAPKIAAKLDPGVQSLKIMRAPGPKKTPTAAPAAAAPGAATAASAQSAPPVVETGTMKGVPHTLEANPAAKTVKLDGGDAVAAGNAAKAALPEAGDPRLPEATQLLNVVNQKLGELRARVGSSTPPTTADLKVLSQATMAAMRAFGDKFNVKSLGDHLPEFPSPVVGPHPVGETKPPPDGSTRESHHAPPVQLAEMLARNLKKVGASLLQGPDSKDLTPAGLRMTQIAKVIETSGHGEGLTAILIHKLTHKASEGTAIHSSDMEPLIRARLSPITEATKQKRIVMMDKPGKRLSVNPRTGSMEKFLADCEVQANATLDAKQKAVAKAEIESVKSQDKVETQRVQAEVVPAAQAVVSEQLNIAFHNSLDQAVAAVEAALSVSHVDGPPAGRAGAGGAIKTQAPKAWSSILNSAS